MNGIKLVFRELVLFRAERDSRCFKNPHSVCFYHAQSMPLFPPRDNRFPQKTFISCGHSLRMFSTVLLSLAACVRKPVPHFVRQCFPHRRPASCAMPKLSQLASARHNEHLHHKFVPTSQSQYLNQILFSHAQRRNDIDAVINVIILFRISVIKHLPDAPAVIII